MMDRSRRPSPKSALIKQLDERAQLAKQQQIAAQQAAATSPTPTLSTVLDDLQKKKNRKDLEKKEQAGLKR